jgi:aldose 1-epimerase
VLTTYGAAIVALKVQDAKGEWRDVVLGFDSIDAYERQDKYIGATIGRYANRIGGSSFTINGEACRLEQNEPPNHLHGGNIGFDKRVWTPHPVQDGVRFTLSSRHLDGGYPGNMDAEVCFTLKDSELTIRYKAASDMDTVCNLTNHSYFNLDGHDGSTILDHIMKLSGQAFTPVAGHECIPDGSIVPVDGTPMDFRAFTRIGERIDNDYGQLLFGRGYDHNWVVDGEPGTLRPAAEVYSPKSGILLRVDTTLPGIQFYSGNYLDGCPVGKGNAVYSKRCAFCLETQFFPDAPNQPAFPQPLLKKGELWEHTTVLRFEVHEDMPNNR